MRYLSLLFLFLSGCATTHVGLEELMRSSYAVGCLEAHLQYRNNMDHSQHVLEMCKMTSKEFNLGSVNGYMDNMEVYLKPKRELVDKH